MRSTCFALSTHPSHRTLHSLVYPPLFTALICACAWVPPIPVGAVSMTLQTFAVYLTAGLLGAKRGTVSVLLYLAIGCLGLPVFSGGRGGIGILLGASGGYLVGFLAISLTVGLAVQMFGRKTIPLTLSMIVGTLFCYLLGTIWYVIAYAAVSFPEALALCVLPYLLPDLIKIVLAVILVRRLERFIKR